MEPRASLVPLIMADAIEWSRIRSKDSEYGSRCLRWRRVAAIVALVLLAGCTDSNRSVTSSTDGTTSALTQPDMLRPVPDENSTGPASDVVLQKIAGPLVIDTPGTVLDGIEVVGGIEIKASGVVLRNSRVVSDGYVVLRVGDDLTGVRVENVEVAGRGVSGAEGSIGIAGAAAVIRTRITQVENGFVPSNGSTLQDSLIEDLAAPGTPHYDGVQIDGGLMDITITGNSIDLGDLGQTAAVMLDNANGPLRNVDVSGNRIVGGSYTIYCDGQFKRGEFSEIVISNNAIGRGTYGHSLIRDCFPTWQDNVDVYSRAEVPMGG